VRREAALNAARNIPGSDLVSSKLWRALSNYLTHVGKASVCEVLIKLTLIMLL